MQKTKRSVDDFIASLPEESRVAIGTIDKTIKEALPKEERVMWEGVFWGGSEQKIIGYGNLTYVGSNKKEVEWFRAGLAQQKNYITVFVNGYTDGMYILEKYGKELGEKVKVGKGMVTIKKLEDINLEKLAEILKKASKLPPFKAR